MFVCGFLFVCFLFFCLFVFCCFFFLLYLKEIPVLNANSADPDQTRLIWIYTALPMSFYGLPKYRDALRGQWRLR